MMKRNIVFFVFFFLLSGASSKAFCSEGGGRGDIEEAIESIVGDYLGFVVVSKIVVNCENSELKKVLTSRDSSVLSEFFNGGIAMEVINSGNDQVELRFKGMVLESDEIKEASDGVCVKLRTKDVFFLKTTKVGSLHCECTMQVVSINTLVCCIPENKRA